MRSSGGTNFGLLLSVVVLAKSRMACFAGPWFHESNGSTAAVAAGCGWCRVIGTTGKEEC